jgi:membrane protein
MALRYSLIRKRIDAAPHGARRPLFVIMTLVQDLIRCDLMKQASAMAYVTLLSLIPSLVAIFCVLSIFSPLLNTGPTSLVEELRGFVLHNLAAGSGEAVVNYLDEMLANLDLSRIGWSSFASVLVTLILLLRQIEEALNRIWLVHKGRNVFTRFMYFWTFLTLGTVMLAVALGVSSGFNLAKLLSLKEQTESGPFGWVAGLSGAYMFFFFLYKVVPNCYVKSKNAAVGALLSAVLLSVASWGYGTFIIGAKSYRTLYGALALLPLFLMWLYICWIIILLGSLVSWRIQEGFPDDDDKDALDHAKTPADRQRNLQIQATLPLVALVAIYREFQQGAGKGPTGQELAHTLRLPLTWVCEALEGLQAFGYIVATRANDSEAGSAATDGFFPALPADRVQLAPLRTKLWQPSRDWMAHWHHDLPMDLPKTIAFINASPNATLADALASGKP